jgi:hypothetical protein
VIQEEKEDDDKKNTVTESNHQQAASAMSPARQSFAKKHTLQSKISPKMPSMRSP